MLFRTLVALILLVDVRGLGSPLRPFATYRHSVELQKDFADLWWSVDGAEREIVFELHVRTTGWIALGISPGSTLIFDLTKNDFERFSFH